MLLWTEMKQRSCQLWAAFFMRRKKTEDSFSKGKILNQAGLELIVYAETGGEVQRYCTAYQDPVGIWTIGIGHTGLSHDDGTVYFGRFIRKIEAYKLLERDLIFFKRKVNERIKVPLNENQEAALVSLAFNVGETVLDPSCSTLARKLNAGDYEATAQQFLRWNKASGKILGGLVLRREAEQALFLSELKKAPQGYRIWWKKKGVL